MTAVPPGPRLQRGSLTVYVDDTEGSQVITIPFQYNPGQLRRTLASRRPPQNNREHNAPQDARLVAGPPTETITIGIELDATDQLAVPDEGRNSSVVENGLNPALSALEMLMYPPSSQFQRNEQLAEQGEAQVAPSNLSLVLLNWGETRVVPVMITSFSITEEEFDTRLNPIRAKVDLGLQVLTYMDLRGSSVGVQRYRSYQEQKENLAQSFYQGASSSQTRNLNTNME